MVSYAALIIPPDSGWTFYAPYSIFDAANGTPAHDYRCRFPGIDVVYAPAIVVDKFMRPSHWGGERPSSLSIVARYALVAGVLIGGVAVSFRIRQRRAATPGDLWSRRSVAIYCAVLALFLLFAAHERYQHSVARSIGIFDPDIGGAPHGLPTASVVALIGACLSGVIAAGVWTSHRRDAHQSSTIRQTLRWQFSRSLRLPVALKCALIIPLGVALLHIWHLDYNWSGLSDPSPIAQSVHLRMVALNLAIVLGGIVGSGLCLFGRLAGVWAIFLQSGGLLYGVYLFSSVRHMYPSIFAEKAIFCALVLVILAFVAGYGVRQQRARCSPAA